MITIDGGPFQQGTDNPPDSLDIAEGRGALLGGDTPANREILNKFDCTPSPGYFSEDFGSLLDDDFLTAVLAFVLDRQAPSPVPGFATAAGVNADLAEVTAPAGSGRRYRRRRPPRHRGRPGTPTSW